MTTNTLLMEHKLMGSGGINVIFLNGFRMPFNNWDKVSSEVAKSNQILLFNRWGIGLSAKAQKPQTGNLIVNEMQSLFDELQLDPPYLLVGHSLGGMFANLFARVYRESVAGLVFVDAPHPMEIAEQKKMKPPFMVRMVNDGLKICEKWFDPYKYSEDECIAETVSQIQSSPPFPDVPVAVVSGTKKMPFVPSEALSIHLRYQERLLDLSPRSTQYRCEDSGHFPQITEPEKVITAIENTLEASYSYM